METFTVEIRDGRDVPRVQAKVTASSLAEALVMAASNPDGTEWVFLQELSGDALTELRAESTVINRRS